MNIGIALALKYDKKEIAPFLNSYEKYASGDLYLVTDRIEQYTGYKKIKPLDINFLANEFNIRAYALTVFNLKPVIFYLLLKKLAKNLKITNALLTDVDLIFQKDPFTLIEETNTDTFLICEEKKYYNECDTNTTWFNAGYIEDYEKVRNKKILNCGFTVGRFEYVLDYQKQVANELQKILATRPYFAYDQVILNVLTYVTKTIQPTIISHGNHYVVHMHHMSNDELLPEIFQNGLICAPTKQPYFVVHQYNEKEVASKFVKETWK
jgi:hypothetical protein